MFTVPQRKALSTSATMSLCMRSSLVPSKTKLAEILFTSFQMESGPIGCYEPSHQVTAPLPFPALHTHFQVQK